MYVFKEWICLLRIKNNRNYRTIQNSFHPMVFTQKHSVQLYGDSRAILFLDV